MSLFSAFAVLGSGTIVSRILGFVRDFLLAVSLGPGLITDSFIVALRFPNLFRRLFAEGAFNAAFVPQFSKRLDGGNKEAALIYGQQALSLMVSFMIIFSGVMIVLMPYIVPFLVPGFVGDAEKFSLTVHLTRITFPYLFCMAVSALLSGMLNSVGRFVATSVAPVVLNIILVFVLLLIYSGYGGMIFGDSLSIAANLLAWGVFAAGLLQLLVMVLACRRAGLHYRLLPPSLNSDMRVLLRKMLPGLLSAGVIQLNLVVGDILASLLGDKAISWLFFADRLVQLPLGVIGVAIAVASLPRFSRSVSSGDYEGTQAHLLSALRISLFFALPASAALIFMPYEIIGSLFGYGHFSDSDVIASGYALRMAAMGLVAFVVIKVLLAVFFAHEDTYTPAMISIVVVLFNGVSAYILMQHMEHAGIALAGSLAGVLNMALLSYFLLRRGHWRLGLEFFIFLVKTIFLVGVMLLSLWFLGGLWSDVYRLGGVYRFLALLGQILPSGILYLLLGWVFRCLDWGDVSR